MPGQFCDAFVELFGVGGPEFADGLEHAKRGAQV